MSERPRRGFAMLTALWLMSVASAMTVASVLVGRIAVDTARNRVNLERARWQALGCARTVQATIDEALRGASSPASRTLIWMDLSARATAQGNECRVSFEAAGSKLDLNTSPVEVLARAFVLLGASEQEALQAAASIDAHRTTRLFDDVRELERLPGLHFSAAAGDVFSAEPARVSLAHASARVLTALPGITAETAEAIVQRASAGEPVADVADVLSSISESSRADLIARYADVSRLTTSTPDAWLLRVAASPGTPPAAVTFYWRLAPLGDHVVVAHSRMLP